LRLLLYNIRYGTGRRTRWAWLHALTRTVSHLPEIGRFIEDVSPDVAGLVEVDSGSYRSGGRNQAEELAANLGHYHSFRVKYHRHGPGRWLPVLNKQANAFLTRDSFLDERFHYFEDGFKKLVIELEMERVNLFLVHLSIGFRSRHRQLSDLHDLVCASSKPCIVAGDFNVLSGPREVRLFLSATGLRSANADHAPTYPSWCPRRELDFVCYTPDLALTRFEIPNVTLSDHLPMICDFRLPGDPA
jgi:endonuclease/exonuclease/phosphatase family metal-dependent hydrolase